MRFEGIKKNGSKTSPQMISQMISFRSLYESQTRSQTQFQYVELEDTIIRIIGPIVDDQIYIIYPPLVELITSERNERKIILEVIYGSPRRHSDCYKTSKKNIKM